MDTEQVTSEEPRGVAPDESFWVEFWNSEEGKKCVLQEPHECLVKFQEKLLRGKSGIKIFVPLCGKTYDLMWLMERGHQVVGVEISEAAVKDFFQLNKLEYSETPVESIGGKLFQSKCGKIRLYVGDFFKFGPRLEKDFNAVWDVEAFHSLPLAKRQPYVEVIKSVITPDCLILVDDRVPCNIEPLSKEGLQKYFGPDFMVEDVACFIPAEAEFNKAWGTKGFYLYCIHK